MKIHEEPAEQKPNEYPSQGSVPAHFIATNFIIMFNLQKVNPIEKT